MQRYQRTSSPSKIYHIMIRGNERKNIFNDDDDKQRFIDTLAIKKAENKFELYAYCLMDNHVHLVISEKDGTIARIMKCICVSYVIYFNKKYNRIGHLFQDRFKSENIDKDSYFLQVIKYIHYNPVKAGLVNNLNEYRWSSYMDYISVKKPSKLTDTGFMLEMLSMQREKALQEFIEFSGNMDSKEEFLEIAEESYIKTKQEAQNFINEYLSEKGIGYEEICQQKGRIKGTVKHELVKELKMKSSLGSREIGELLGLSKSSVNNLV